MGVLVAMILNICLACLLTKINHLLTLPLREFICLKMAQITRRQFPSFCSFANGQSRMQRTKKLTVTLCCRNLAKALEARKQKASSLNCVSS